MGYGLGFVLNSIFSTGVKVSNASVAELVASCEEENDIQLETKIHVKMSSTLIF